MNLSSVTLSHAGTVESMPDLQTGEVVMPKQRIKKDKPATKVPKHPKQSTGKSLQQTFQPFHPPKRSHADTDDEGFESEMVALERIDVQKKYLKRFFTAKGKRTGYGRDLPAGSMAMHNISFGTKGRF